MKRDGDEKSRENPSLDGDGGEVVEGMGIAVRIAVGTDAGVDKGTAVEGMVVIDVVVGGGFEGVVAVLVVVVGGTGGDVEGIGVGDAAVDKGAAVEGVESLVVGREEATDDEGGAGEAEEDRVAVDGGFDDGNDDDTKACLGAKSGGRSKDGLTKDRLSLEGRGVVRKRLAGKEDNDDDEDEEEEEVVTGRLEGSEGRENVAWLTRGSEAKDIRSDDEGINDEGAGDVDRLAFAW